jgi:hypothetical protein
VIFVSRICRCHKLPTSTSAIEAGEAGERETDNQPCGPKEDCGNATEEMGAGEGEEGQLARQRNEREAAKGRLGGHQ